MSEPFGGDDVHRHASQQKVRGVNVPQIVESCHGKRAHALREVGIVRPVDLASATGQGWLCATPKCPLGVHQPRRSE